MKLLTIALLLLILTPTIGSAETISWSPTLEREDGTPMIIDEIQGYRVYYSNGVSGTYPNVIDIAGANITTATIPDATVDIHAVVTTVDTGGRESAYSLEHLIPVAAINTPPTGYWLASTPKEITAGDSIVVGVGATDADGTIQAITLYLDNTMVRQETKAPYLWNNTGQDALLQNMAAGTYKLAAQITDNDGATITITRALKVVALPNPPIVQ